MTQVLTNAERTKILEEFYMTLLRVKINTQGKILSFPKTTLRNYVAVIK